MKILMIVLCLVFLLHLSATIINVPADQPTIQAGIDVTVHADTVLVQPGTYLENINYNGKNITVGSLYLITQDITYISQTTIDGNHYGSVVRFENEEDSTAVITGFTITNGQGNTIGGGIFCNNSSPTIENMVIIGNSAVHGGGIGIIPHIATCRPSLRNVTITGNTATNRGGGIHCINTSLDLENVTISNNIATNKGGGIFCSGSNLNFNFENRSSIYSNSLSGSRGYGTDIYASSCDNINVIVDTFTVLTPTDFHTSPLDIFNFDIIHSVQDPLINSDLYVSVNGDDSNIGITPDEPLKTIRYALSIIFADSLNHNTIYLLPGIYSPSTTGEIFPIACSNYVSIEGMEGEDIILDANNSNCVMTLDYVNNIMIRNITLRNGSSGGIYCFYSNPNIENVNILDNSAYFGGGLRCRFSSPNLLDVIISGNSADDSGAGIHCANSSSPSLTNVVITDNSADDKGGGIYCDYDSNPILTNVIISDNSATDGGGVSCFNNSNPQMLNVVISNNTAHNGGGLYIYESEPILINSTLFNNTAIDDGGGIYSYTSWLRYINCISWNDSPQEVYFSLDGYLSFIAIANSDIQDGEAGIVTNNNGTVYWLDGNIIEDPLMINPYEEDYHLQDTSPCIGAGITEVEIISTWYYSPEFDIEGNLRPNPIGSMPDIGAYENILGEPVGIDNYHLPNVGLQLMNYPNPFNPSTTIEFSIKSDSKVELSIFNIKGQKIQTLIQNELIAGKHSIIWNGDNDSGVSVSSGLYLYKLNVDGKSEVIKKCLLLK